MTFVAFVTMGFVATATEEATTSVVAVGEAKIDDAPTPTAVPVAPTAELMTEVAGVVLEARGATDRAGSDAAVVDADAYVPEDFLPVFVSDDLTDKGAHTSVTTPVPVAPQPPALTPTTSEPSARPVPSRPTVDRPPTPASTPVSQTPVDPNGTDTPEPGGDEPSAADWAALRKCESGGNYSVDSGNGYYGAYQFSQATWDWVASMVRPDLVGVVPSEASSSDQDALAFALYDVSGAAPWPTCGSYLR